MKRKAVTDKMKWQALFYRFPIPCSACNIALFWDEEIDWDHVHPIALGGQHTHQNLRPLHVSCHQEKTSGSKATTAGSDIHAIAKVKRLQKGPRKRKGRKMQSKPFPKIHRPMRSRPLIKSEQAD